MGIRTTGAWLAAAAMLVTGCDKDDDRIGIAPDLRIIVAVSGVVTDQGGVPIGGATVSAIGRSFSTALSDPDGRYSFPTIQAVANEDVIVTAIKTEYLSASGAARPTGPSLEINLSLTARPMLPIEGSLTGTLYPGDPGNYVGNLYESDYAFNVRSFILKSEDEPVEIQLAWAQAGNAALRIWSADETRSASPDGQSIRWPAHTAGLVLVGQMGARLTQPVAFTLTTRR